MIGLSTHTNSCNDNIISSLVHSDIKELKEVIDHKDKYEVQIRYTQIDRDKNGMPSFRTFEYNVDDKKYFYPASTVKMPVAFLALQYLREKQKEGYMIDMMSPLRFGANRPIQSEMAIDTFGADGPPTTAKFIEEIFAISDNNAFNRLYELLGPSYINNELRRKGIFESSRIVHRVGVSGYTFEENMYLNPLAILGKNALILPARKDSITLRNDMKGLKKGRAYYDKDEKLVNKHFDFSLKNIFTIRDLEACIRRILFPESYHVYERFDLRPDDYKYLYSTMMKLPKEIPYLAHDSTYYDGFVKFFYNGQNKEAIPHNIKILNKIGCAYGTLTDCSYIFDINSGAEFLLTATVNVNTDGIYNDDKYEYAEIGYPFLAALGQEVLKYEQHRIRNYKADFSKFLQR